MHTSWRGEFDIHYHACIHRPIRLLSQANFHRAKRRAKHPTNSFGHTLLHIALYISLTMCGVAPAVHVVPTGNTSKGHELLMEESRNFTCGEYTPTFWCSSCKRENPDILAILVIKYVVYDWSTRPFYLILVPMPLRRSQAESSQHSAAAQCVIQPCPINEEWRAASYYLLFAWSAVLIDRGKLRATGPWIDDTS